MKYFMINAFIKINHKNTKPDSHWIGETENYSILKDTNKVSDCEINPTEINCNLGIAIC